MKSSVVNPLRMGTVNSRDAEALLLAVETSPMNSEYCSKAWFKNEKTYALDGSSIVLKEEVGLLMAREDGVQSVDGVLVALPDHIAGFLEGWLGALLKARKEAHGLCYKIHLGKHHD